MHSACLQMVVLNTLVELHQFMDGLTSLGVTDTIQDKFFSPSILCSANKMELTSGTHYTILL